MSEQKCAVDGCEREQAHVGLCGRHYQQNWRTKGSFPICAAPGCDRDGIVRGVCDMHRQRLRAKGSFADPAPRPTDTERFWSKVAVPDENGCRVWLGERDREGYGRFSTTPEGGKRQRKWRASRFAYEDAVGPIPPGRQLLHSCDNPPCVEPTHLRPGTGSENVQEALARGLWNPPRGTSNPRAVLNDDLVRQIRRLYVPRLFSYRRIAAALGLSEIAVKGVIEGRTWRHVA